MDLKSALDSLPKTDKNVVVVLSGGLDSTILTHILVEKYGHNKVYALSYNYGQKQKKELELANRTCKRLRVFHKTLDLSILGEIAKGVSANIDGSNIRMPTIKDVLGDPQPKTYVPFRNMILNSLAFSYAEAYRASHVFTGLQVHDEYGYWDTTQKFVDAMNNVASQNRTFKVRMEAPFSKLSKLEEINIMKELYGDDEIVKEALRLTLTCYNPNEDGESCGKCPSCSERINAFAKAKIIDPISYAVELPWSELCVR